MSKKTIYKLISVIVFSGLMVSGYYFLFYNKDKAGNTIADNTFGWKFPVAKFPITGSGGQIAYSTIRNPGGVPEGLPVRLQVPAIGVDSIIEDALITPDGRMDVPAGSVNVAWFSLGPHPGDVGSAVIGGHFGIRNGVPFVFYNLDKLKIDDKVYIVNDKDETLAFVVRSIKSFDRNADATTVFTSEDGLAHLNLITCEGIWNQVNGNYPNRLIVFTDAIPGEGDIVVNVSVIFATLRIGSHGADVTALQNVLNQKRFSGISLLALDGFFGALTRNAVVKYQKSVGLLPDGIFGPLSRARLASELSAIEPNLPFTSIMPSKSISFFENIILSVKSLYATEVDGLVTSFLLISIFFLIFKVVGRHKRILKQEAK